VTELPSAEQDESPANRQYINECLRRGIGLQQPNVAQPGTFVHFISNGTGWAKKPDCF